jgi:hypothetical protein
VFVIAPLNVPEVSENPPAPFIEFEIVPGILIVKVPPEIWIAVAPDTEPVNDPPLAVNPPVGTVNAPDIIPPVIVVAPVFPIVPLRVPLVSENPPPPFIEHDIVELDKVTVFPLFIVIVPPLQPPKIDAPLPDTVILPVIEPVIDDVPDNIKMPEFIIGVSMEPEELNCNCPANSIL